MYVCVCVWVCCQVGGWRDCNCVLRRSLFTQRLSLVHSHHFVVIHKLPCVPVLLVSEYDHVSCRWHLGCESSVDDGRVVVLGCITQLWLEIATRFILKPKYWCQSFCCTMRCISAAYAVMRCLSVCPCVCLCLSRSWVVSKWIKISSKFFHHWAATPF